MALPALMFGLSLLAAPIPLRLPADVDDALAPAVNPAGLGFLEGAELRLLLARDLKRDRTDLGLFTAIDFGTLSFGSSLEVDQLNGPGDVIPGFSAAIASQVVSLGFGWRGGAAPSTFSLGLTWRLNRNFSASFSSLDLGQKLGPRPYDIGLGFRALSDRLLVSARWRILQGESISSDDGRADITGLLSVEPIAGLILSGSTDLHFRPAFQISLNFEHLVATGAVRSDAGGEPGTAIAELAVVSRDLPSALRPARIAVLELSGDLVPAPRLNLLALRFDAQVYGGVPLLLDELARSENAAGAFIKIGPLAIGWGRAEELRDGIARLVHSGKRVDCLLSAAGDLEVFVASACSSVAAIPSLPFGVDGIAANLVFLADGLEMIGVRPQSVSRGEYKSAPEMFTRSGMSAPARESLEAMLNDTYASLAAGLQNGRKLDRAAVDAVVAEGTMTATEAKSHGLIDAVIYPDEAEEWLIQAHGRPVSFFEGGALPRPTRQRWGRRPRIALVSVDAAITGGESSELPFGLGAQSGAVTLVRTLEALRSDSSISGVVIRIDSPGGDAVASDLIARSVAELARDKPVIASFGDVAASGGYYIAAPATAIYAEPSTITGSIGIFSLGFSIEGLLAKLGVHADGLTIGAGANRGTILRDWTPAEQAMTDREVGALYAQFLRVVAGGRKMKIAEVDERARGRVWTGKAAKERGLVDEIGGLVDAVQRARIEARIDPDEEIDLLVIPRSGRSLPEAVRSLGAALVGEDERPLELVPHALRQLAQAAASILKTAQSSRGMAILPYVLEVD